MLLTRQGEELSPVRGKAEAMGVKEIYIDDLREEFVRDYVFPMFRCSTHQHWDIPAPCMLSSVSD